MSAQPAAGVLRPGIAGTLFPHLPRRSLAPFQLGLTLMSAGLVVFSTMRVTSVVVAISVFGPPTLFLIYLVASGVIRDLPRLTLPLTAVAGAALGVGWSRLAQSLAGTGFGLPIPVPGAQHPVLAGAAAAVAGALLMVLPAVIARCLPVSSPKALDGYAIGVTGALLFTAGSTLTRLANQFHTGIIQQSRPRSTVVVEAGLCGVAIPLTAAATGGVIGLALWMRPRPGRGGAARRALWALGAAVIAIHAVIGMVDAAGLPQLPMLAVHLALCALALLALRSAIRLAGPDDQPARRLGFGPVVGWLTAVIGIAAAVGLAVTSAVTVPASPYLCPPQCGRPPHGAPVSVLPRFAPEDQSFSVAYPAPGSAYDVTTGDRAVTARFTAGDGGVMQLFSEPAAGRSPREVVLTVLRRTYPDAALAYEIPNAMVGYQRGFGVAADDWPQSSLAGYRRIRLLVLGAVKNDLALVAFGVGPDRAFRPGFGPGPPSGANLELAMDMGKYVNSFRWQGDPPR